MHSLFSKLFLSFILITLLAGIGSLMISRLAPVGPLGGLEKQLTNLRMDDLSHLLSVSSRAIVKILEQGNEEKLIEFLTDAGNNKHDRFFLLRNNYSTFSGRTPPPGAVQVARKSQKTNTLQHRITEKEIIIGLPFEHNGNSMIVIGISDRKAGAQSNAGSTRKVRGFFPIIIMALFAAPVCYLLARSFTAPIRDLRRATRKIARGDFSARVDLFGSRSDEIVSLSRDFNTMAKKTQSLLESQKRLLRDISHELRSPLTRLNVALELARQHPGNDESQLQRIEKEAEQIDELIGKILTLARKETLPGENPRQAVNLRKLLDTIIQNAQFESKADNLKIEINNFDDITVSGSTEMLSRALENVIRNGLRYTEHETGIEIAVTEDKNQVTVSVRDHGPGVPDELLKQIFKPFFRVTEARDRSSGGTGIGLAIAEQAILMHGGSIKAKNVEDGGLLIKIVLPLQ